MTTTFLSVWAALVAATPLDEAPAVELQYSGTLKPISRNGPGTPVKRFNVYCLAMTEPTGGRRLGFFVEERGGGGWPWPERFGRIPLDEANRPTNETHIRLLQSYQGMNYPISLRSPLFEYADKLKEGARWTVGKDRYQVTTRETIGDRECWRVEVATNFGHRQTVWVDDGGPIVVRLQQRLFMGQGDAFLLEMALDSLDPVETSRLERLRLPLETLLELQDDLDRKENAQRPELSDPQLQTAAAVLDRLQKQADSTPFRQLAEAIARDVESQRERSEDVAKLAGKFVNRPAPEFELTSLEGETVAAEDTDGKIVLLHFWNYTDDPLVEPYGQVGYLDFLNNQRGKLGVEVYGVAVNSRLANDNQAPRILRSIRKLKDFMNLGYPVTLDDGSLLKRFGDPREHGAKLPLWVVIGPDGTIVHYKVGFYKIEPDEGLRELDEVIVEQIKRQRRDRN